jgi:hypothetical protein
MEFTVLGNNRVMPSDDYRAFGALVRALKEREEEVSVLTFNYDIGVDFGLWASDVEIDYCLRPKPDEFGHGRPAVELAKLHGSTNWVECSRCDAVSPRTVRDIVEAVEKRWEREGSKPWGQVNLVTDPLSMIPHNCGAPYRVEPYIVPPTPEKGQRRQALSTVWKRAATRLREAENIFVLGYSWPKSDQFFHQLFALGTVGHTILRRFYVFDPNPTVKEHFATDLLGPQALATLGPKTELASQEFGPALDHVAGLFELNANTLRHESLNRARSR